MSKRLKSKASRKPGSSPSAEGKKALRAVGLRATAARVAVLRCLWDASAPLTHSEVCEALSSSGYDRATLYRNLIDLTEAGLARRGDLGDHLWRFERASDDDHDEQSHAHFVCRECGDVSCLPERAFTVTPTLDVPRAIHRRAVEIQVRGLCNACD